MKFAWDDHGITATLAFGSSSQKCYIPADSIAAIYSPEMQVQLFTSVTGYHADKQDTVSEFDHAAEDRRRSGRHSGNVINVDFVSRKRIEDDNREDA
jgi:hypothetical protein